GSAAGTRPPGRSLRGGRVRGQERPYFQPFVDRLAARAGGGGQFGGEFERPLVAVDVDHHPAGDEVLGLRERAVGDRRPALAVVADERALRGERLAVDVLAGALQPVGEVLHVLQVGGQLLGRPLVHRHVVDRRGRASVVLEQQVLGHDVLLVAARPIVAVFTAGTEPLAHSRHPPRHFFPRVFRAAPVRTATPRRPRSWTAPSLPAS